MKKFSFTEFQQLSPAERFLFVGNLAILSGVFFCGIGNLLKLLETGSLPTNPSITGCDYSDDTRSTSLYSGRGSGYFQS